MPLLPDTVFGVYEVLGPLGAGGMGEVYRARDRRLGREVAIKVLPEELAEKREHADWLVREARLLASLSHPNIAVVYGLEESAGIRALVMELVPGETLGQRLARGPLPVKEALSVCRQAAGALEFAHRQGVVHRDLKPSNLMVLPDGTVKVVDFGLARVFRPAPTAASPSQSPTLASDRTLPGTVLGTIAYMSPEQARGRPVDRQSDVWALGCVLFEAVTARPAFGGDTAADAFASILDRDPDWSLLPAGCPSRIRELIEKCLRKSRDERLHDIGEARLEIEAILETMSRPPAPAPEAPAPVPGAGGARRAPRLAALPAAALALLVLAAAAAGVRWMSSRSAPSAGVPKERVLVVLPFRDDDPAGRPVGEGIAEFLAARLARSGVQVVTQGGSGGGAADPDFARLGRELGVNLAVRGYVQRQAGNVRVTFSLVGVPGGAILTGDAVSGSPADLFDVEDRMVEHLAGYLGLPPGKTALPREQRPGGQAGQGQYLAALGLLRRWDDEASVAEALRLLEAVPDGAGSAVVQAALSRAHLYRYQQTRNRAEADAALEASARAARLDPGTAEVPLTVGEVLLATGNAKEAERSFRKALEIQPAYAGALDGLSRALEASGRLDEAEEAGRRAASLRPAVPQGWVRLGTLFYHRGDYARAVDEYRRAALLDPDDARTQYRLGAALFQADRLDEARAALERSIALGPTPPALSNLGTLLYALGKFPEAAAAFEKAAEARPKDSLLWVNLGDARRHSGGGPAAGEAYRRAEAAAREELAVNANDPGVQLTLAVASARLGDETAGRRHLARALQMAGRDPETLVQAAILETLWKQDEAALTHLELAVEAGSRPGAIAREPDLARLSDQPRFRALTAREGTKGGRP